MCETMLNRKSPSGRIELYIGKELKEAVNKSGLNASKFMREKLVEYFKESGIAISIPEPTIIILARCPSCGCITQTSSIIITRCSNCGKAFRPYLKTKPSSRIVKIVKGTIQDLHREYYRIYGRYRVI